MIHKIKKFIKQNHLFDLKRDKLLLALSGGLDSVVLLDILYKLGVTMHLAHVNYALRGEESIEDQKWVESLAKKYQLPLHLKDAANEINQSKGSIQLQARDIRYNWLKELKIQYQLDYIITAHHLDDQVETFLMNLIRGASIKGIAAMPSKTDLIRRPMISCTKKMILNYAMENHLPFREDSSNLKSDYTRNKVRNQLLPLIQTLNPSFSQLLYESIQSFKEISLFTISHAESFLAEHIQKNEIQIVDLKKSEMPLTILQIWLQKYGFSQRMILDIAEHMHHSESACYAVNNYILYRSSGILKLENKEINDCKEIPVDMKIGQTYQWNEFISFQISDQLNQGEKDFFACKEIDSYDGKLIFRKRKKGDYLPDVQKKLSEWMKKAAWPKFKRDHWPVLTLDDKVLWIPGARQSKQKETHLTNHSIYILFFENE